ncbi:MAG: PAS domain-containing sensor histidine kinase [Hyphomicrobiaceae bacterium]|nr:PAS domain-containing sensor histidine kinase [Hyphomicrobiaceae bacterium]
MQAKADPTQHDRAPAPSRAILDDARLPMADTASPAFYIGLVVVSLAIVSGLATFIILTGLSPIVPRSSVVVPVLFINVLLIVAMIGVIAWQIVGLFQAWRDKVAGTRLHVRIVALFSVIAALPAILLAFAATTTFSRALDGWFSARTRTIIQNSLNVANAYLEEHGQVIRTDIVNMAKDLDDAAEAIGGDRTKLRDLVFVQAGLRDLPAAYVIDSHGRPLVTAIENKKLPYRPPPISVIRLAEAGHVPLLMPKDSYRVAAVTKLTKTPGAYLFVARGVNPQVLRHWRKAQAGVAEYQQLRSRSGGLKVAHAMLYFMISLTALLAAIWAGLWFAGRFVAPIRRLIGAAQIVSTGDLNVVLPVRRGEGDLRRLSETFNTMTSELKTQRDALVTANEQLVERRRFMEAVLSGVSAGVIGLDADGRITLASPSAAQLLAIEADALQGIRLADAVPAFAEALAEPFAKDGKSRTAKQISMDVAGEERTFALMLTKEQSGEASGAVVTFDDITELVSAQRTSAWADVARRIAHEIKNPLTPIQLSAERLKRKYGRVITEDREVFDKCTETIIRQVGDVSRMVDEFASFARMPKPQKDMQDLRDAVKDAVHLFQMSDSTIKYVMQLPDTAVPASYDRRLISQAMTNLIKNGAEAIQGYIEAGSAPDGFKGLVETRMSLRDDGRAVIEVIDNGTGLSKQNRARLLEPYVTTKAKGTGLGLAIVQKVIEQHGGTLTLEDATTIGRDHGALVRIVLPLDTEQTRPAAAENNRTGAHAH